MGIVFGTQLSRNQGVPVYMWYQKLYKAIIPLHFRGLVPLFSVSDISGYISKSNRLFLKKKKVRINFLKPLLRSDMKQYHQITGNRVQKIFKGCYFKMYLPPSLFAIRLNQLFSIF